jgi:UPF0755 protein
MLKKIFISLIFILLISGGGVAYYFYSMIYQPNVTLAKGETGFFYIPTGSTIEDVTNSLYEQNLIKNTASFSWVAEKKNYQNHVNAGRYLLKPKMSNDDLVNLLRSANQEPVMLTFNSVRLINDLAGVVAKQIEADSVALAELFNSNELFNKYGFNKHTFRTMFIPNTYEMYWNTSAEDFVKRMAKEYKSFWNTERIAKAKKIGLSQSEVSTLASIVEKETAKSDEKPEVAGVYMNRIKKGMRLEADPTLIFAANDFTIRRVLNKHKLINSPYNTYMYRGLPPGPITISDISSIDAVLNYKKHNYVFFCAKDDFSGYHNFAATYSQHKANARKWYRAMNAKKVYK